MVPLVTYYTGKWIHWVGDPPKIFTTLISPPPHSNCSQYLQPESQRFWVPYQAPHFALESPVRRTFQAIFDSQNWNKFCEDPCNLGLGARGTLEPGPWNQVNQGNPSILRAKQPTRTPVHTYVWQVKAGRATVQATSVRVPSHQLPWKCKALSKRKVVFLPGSVHFVSWWRLPLFFDLHVLTRTQGVAATPGKLISVFSLSAFDIVQTLRQKSVPKMEPWQKGHMD